MASNIAKRHAELSAPDFGDIAANVKMLNKSQVETYLDNLCSDLNTALDGKVDSVAAADASVTVTGGKSAVVGVQISAATGNLLELANDGLKVIAPAAAEYTCEKLTTAETGFSASYAIKKDGVQVGATINIPKDMVVSSGTVETKSTSGAWGEAGTYLVLTLANATSDTVYINVGDLIEYVTSGSQTGDQVVIAVSSDHKVTATISAGTITATELSSGVNADIAKGVAAKTATEGILDGTTLDSFGDVETALSGKQANLSEAQLAAANSGITAAKVEKLDGVEAGAQKNVQSDWSAASGDAFIKNKPTLGALAAKDEVAESDLASALASKINGKVDAVEGKGLSENDFTDALKTKLEGIAAGAEVNVQSDWSQTNNSADDYIKNKPTLGALAAKDDVAYGDLASGLKAKIDNYDAARTAVAAVTIPTEDAVTLRSLRTAVVALQTAIGAVAS